MHYPDREWIDVTLPQEFVIAKRHPRKHFFKIIDMLGESRGRGPITEDHV